MGWRLVVGEADGEAGGEGGMVGGTGGGGQGAEESGGDLGEGGAMAEREAPGELRPKMNRGKEANGWMRMGPI